MLRGFMLGAAAAVSLGLATPAHAVVELQWWHAMTGGNNDVIVKLASDFNAAQSDYKVVPSYKGSYADTMNAGIAAYRAGNAPAPEPPNCRTTHAAAAPMHSVERIETARPT